MARLETYPFDKKITDEDAWIGTEAGTKFTKQYTAAGVADYLNTNGKIVIGGQTTYKFNSTPYDGIGTFASLGKKEDEALFRLLSYISISEKDLGGQNADEFFKYLIGSDIMISKQSDISVFGHYTITGFAFEKEGFYNMTISHIGGPKGAIEVDEIYNIFTFTLPSSSSDGDKTFEFKQSVPSKQWTVNHNLNKFPSVSVVNSNFIAVQGLVTYISNSELTIDFSAGFSGKAYLN